MTINDQERKEIEESLNLLQSDEWRHYAKFLKIREQREQKYVNEAVRNGDILEAKIHLALMEDNRKQAGVFIQSVKDRAKNVQKEQGNG